MNLGFEVDETTDREGITIDNQSWFVDLKLSEFCKTYSIPSSYENDLLVNRIVIAMDEVNASLLDYRLNQLALGYESLSDVPSDEINGTSDKVIQYKRAVFSRAKSELIRANLSLALSAEAESQAKTSGELASHYMTVSTKAIALVQGKPSKGVYLI